MFILAALSGIHRFKNTEHMKLGGNNNQGREGNEKKEMGSRLGQYTLYEYMKSLINKKLNYNCDRDCHYPLSFIHSFFYTSPVHNSLAEKHSLSSASFVWKAGHVIRF